MRSTAAVLLLALSACTRWGSAQSGIFREITIGDGSQELKLGAPIRDDVQPLLVAAGKDTYRVRPGMYGGADSITVSTRPDGTVRCIAFAYGPGESYDFIVAGYEQDLGAPATRFTSPDSLRQITEWHDARTAFVVTREGGRVSSMLCEPDRIEGGQKPAVTVGGANPARG
ncbi:MAG TPA: hypothetical protein VLK66_09795 [Longimicrobium sp.]|nr:hypothetical protein [Longimicrobium sp.]